MKIDKQLFEDVLSGKLKGIFVLRNTYRVSSNELKLSNNLNTNYPYYLNNGSYTNCGRFNIKYPGTLDIIDFIPDTDMKENELTIEIPYNKVVDWDESKKQNKIVLKDKQLTYGDITRSTWLTNINNFHYFSEHQLECILAKNKLANVAKYLNSLSDETTAKYYIYNGYNLNVVQLVEPKFNLGLIMFKSAELARQAIEILGEETVKLALEPLGI